MPGKQELVDGSRNPGGFQGDSGHSGGGNSGRTIGIAVGVSVGCTVLLAGVGAVWWALHRRQTRQAPYLTGIPKALASHAELPDPLGMEEGEASVKDRKSGGLMAGVGGHDGRTSNSSSVNPATTTTTATRSTVGAPSYRNSNSVLPVPIAPGSASEIALLPQSGTSGGESQGVGGVGSAGNALAVGGEGGSWDGHAAVFSSEHTSHQPPAAGAFLSQCASVAQDFEPKSRGSAETKRSQAEGSRPNTSPHSTSSLSTVPPDFVRASLTSAAAPSQRSFPQLPPLSPSSGATGAGAAGGWGLGRLPGIASRLSLTSLGRGGASAPGGTVSTPQDVGRQLGSFELAVPPAPTPHPLQEIQQLAAELRADTSELAMLHPIGQGGFGTVYKGERMGGWRGG